MEEVRRESIGSLLGFLLSLAVLVGLLPLLLDALGPEGYAAWVLTAGLVNLIALFDFGLFTTVARFVARDRRRHPEKAEEVVTVGFISLAVIGIAVALSAQAIAPVWAGYLDVPGAETAVRCSGVAVMFVLVAKAFQGALEGSGRVALNRIVQALGTLLFVCSSVIVALSSSDELDALGVVVLAYSLGICVAFAALTAWEWGGHLPLRRVGQETWRPVLRYAFGVQASAAMHSAAEPLSRVLVGAVVGPEAAAQLDLALRVRFAWFGGATAFVSPVLPRMGQDGRSALDEGAVATEIWRRLLLPAAAGGVFLALAAYTLLPQLFGPEIGTPAAPYALVAVLLWIPAVTSLVPFAYVVLFGRALDLIAIQVATSALGLALSLPLTWLTGAWGPIIGLGMGATFGALATIMRARRYAGPAAFRDVSLPRAVVVRAVAGVGAAVAIMLMPLPLAFCLPVASVIWLMAIAPEIRQALNYL